MYLEKERHFQSFNIASTINILETVEKEGYFVYSPRFWNFVADFAIEELLALEFIVPATQKFGGNWSYVYLKGV